MDLLLCLLLLAVRAVGSSEMKARPIDCKRLNSAKLLPVPENRSSSFSTPSLLGFAFSLLPWCSAVSCSRDLSWFILKQAGR